MKNSAFPSLILITESHIIFIETFIILPIKILQRIFNKFYKLLIFRYFTNMILLIFGTCLFLVKYGIFNYTMIFVYKFISMANFYHTHDQQMAFFRYHAKLYGLFINNSGAIR